MVKALKKLKELHLIYGQKKYPNIPAHARPPYRGKPNSTNGLNGCICDMINYLGGFAWRQSTEGRYRPGKVLGTNIMGREVKTPSKWIPAMKTGLADIMGTYGGRAVAIETKNKDKMRDSQRAFKDSFESSGGWYLETRSLDHFWEEFRKEFGL